MFARALTKCRRILSRLCTRYTLPMVRRHLSPLFSALLITIVGGAIYANSLDGPFVFDDLLSIRDCPNIRSLTPFSEAITAPGGSGASGRPLVALSLAINYAIGALEVRGYHLFNVAVHIASALALLGIARRTLERTRHSDHSQPLALAIALLWVAHPLHTDALNHVIYRNEAMGSLFYLLTLYCASRAFDLGRRRLWQTLAILACSAGMMSKELMVSAPLMVLVYDRTFVNSSFAESLKRNRHFYAVLAATWIVLVVSMESGHRGYSVGFSTGTMSSGDYLRTQAIAIVQYLRLAFWPSPLLFDYSGWKPAYTWGGAIAPGVLVISLVAASGVAFRQRRPAGFLGVLFFAVLAPSSSFIPLAGEWIAEHRMYLPLAALLGLLVPAAWRGIERISGARAPVVGVALLLIPGTLLGWATVKRNEVYSTRISLWTNTVSVDPGNGRANWMLASSLREAGRPQEALPYAEEAVRLTPTLKFIDSNFGQLLIQLGEWQRAAMHLEKALVDMEDDPSVHANLGLALSRMEKWPEALFQMRKALELDPALLQTRRNQIHVLRAMNRPREAIVEARRHISIHPDDLAVHLLLGEMLTEAGELESALACWLRGGELDPQTPRRQLEIAMALDRLGRIREALPRLRAALRRQFDLSTAQFLVGILASHPDDSVRDGAEAVKLCEAFLAREKGANPALLDVLAAAYAEMGRFEEAEQTAARALHHAQEMGKNSVARGIEKRLELYREGRSYRMAPR